MKHFLTLFGSGVGKTLFSTVVRPSVDRRGTMLKHIAFMLLFLLGSLNVWGADPVSGSIVLGNASGAWNATTTASFTDENDLEWSRTYSSNNKQSIQGGMCQFGNSSNPCTSLVLSTTIGSQVTLSAFSANFTGGASKTSGTIKLYSGTTELASATVSGTASVICEIPSSVSVDASDAIKVEYTGTNGSIKISGISYTYTSGSGGPAQPTVSADPDEVTDIVAAGVTNQTIDLTYENIENYTTEVTLHDDAEGNETFSGSWLTASIDNTYATITYSVSANTGDARTAYIKVHASGDDDKEKTIIIPVTQAKYTAPTGTFELFSGDIEEGDYVIVSTNALSNTANNSRIAAETVNITENKIVNPATSVIWHIAQNGEYWTIYNEKSSKYAAGTTSKNQGAILESITDLAKWGVEEKDDHTYNFINYGRSQQTSDSDKKYLRYNSSTNNINSRWGCYAETGVGSPVSLYKKQVAGQPKAPTFSVAGGNYESAQSVEISCETAGATIYYTTNGDAPTSSSTQYNGTAIAVDHTMTIKAIAIKDEISSTVASATYTIIVWQTVADVWDNIVVGGPKNAHVYGYVSQTNVGGYENNFYISDDGSTVGNQLYAYRMDMNSFSVEVGDKVKLAGDLTNHQGTKEFEYANQGATQGRVIALEAKGAVTSVAVSGTATKTTYSANETFETAGLVVTATYANGFSEVVTEGITWGDDLTDHKVTESTTVQVTATVGGVISAAYGVAIEVSTKELVSIALSADEFEVYQGLELPKPTVTATYSEGEPEDVTALAEFTGYNKNTPGEQTITVSYSFGTGDPIEETYTVTVKPIYNVELPASVARDLIINSVGSAGSGANEMIIRGIVVNPSNPSNSKQTYYISDDGSNTNTVEIFKGLYIDGAKFTANNKLIAGDEVVVKGAVTYYQSSTPEFSEGSILQSLARTPNFEIEAVTGFEVGPANLAVADLTITQDGEGAVTLASSDKEEFVTIEGGKLHAVAPGTATITANLDPDGIYKAATTTFSVTVIPAQVKYAITFDGNGADGGEAPEAIANKAAGAEVTLPANAWTKTGYTFCGWKVFYVDGESVEQKVTISENAFTMPAFAVTIQAQWAEISEWAVKYTSNVTLTAGTGAQAAKVRFTADGEQYDAVKAGTGKAGGSITVTVPAQATKLHLHVAGWTGENPTISITAPEGVTVTPASISATQDEGMNSNSPFTLKNDPVDQYLVLSLSGNTEEIQLTFSTDAGNKRFALYGVNQEGGIVPVLDHIVVTGTATALEYEVGDVFNPAGLGANAIYTLGGIEQDPVAIDAEDIEWSFEPATIAANTTAVTVTATYEGKSADKEVTGLTVSVPEPEIIVSAASLAFGNKAKGVAVDDKELTVTLKSVENATLTITGDGASAFSVTPALTASGTVAVSASTANVGTFNATLTISDDAGAAEAKTVDLSITVEASDDISGTWNLVTDAAELMAGMQVIVASVADGEGNLYTLGGPRGNNGDNRLAVASTSTVSGTVLNPEAGTKVLTLVDAGNGLYALQLVNGNYLYAASSSSNYLKEKETLDDNGKWSISISEGKANIVSQGTNTRNTIRHNYSNNSNLFSCYASGQQDIVLYAKAFDYSREIAQGVLSTTCLPNGGKICGASVFEIAYMDYEADGTTPHKIYFDEVEGGIMEAGMPYVVLANEGSAKFGVYYTDSENKSAQSKNGLVGYMGERRSLVEDDYFIYDNKFFYVSAADATSGRIHISNNRAYINLSQVPGYQNEPVVVPAPRRRVSLGNGNNAPAVATGVEDVQGDNVQCTKVLINGQLFILRGEKMYDAKGQLVK